MVNNIDYSVFSFCVCVCGEISLRQKIGKGQPANIIQFFVVRGMAHLVYCSLELFSDINVYEGLRNINFVDIAINPMLLHVWLICEPSSSIIIVLYYGIIRL